MMNISLKYGLHGWTAIVNKNLINGETEKLYLKTITLTISTGKNTINKYIIYYNK